MKDKIKIKFCFKLKHNSAIMNETENEVEHFPITHHEKSGRNRNLKLIKNPNPNDSSDAYIVKKLRKHKPNDFSKEEKAWVFIEQDELKIKELYKNKKK